MNKILVALIIWTFIVSACNVNPSFEEVKEELVESFFIQESKFDSLSNIVCETIDSRIKKNKPHIRFHRCGENELKCNKIISGHMERLDLYDVVAKDNYCVLRKHDLLSFKSNMRVSDGTVYFQHQFCGIVGENIELSNRSFHFIPLTEKWSIFVDKQSPLSVFELKE